MRIIAGDFRSRKLLSPPEGAPTRPIPDRVKESLFSILRGHLEGAAIFDAFAGCGSIGLEALSRGASRCVFVERDKAVAAMLQRNIESLGVADRAELVIGDALGPGARARCPRPVTLAFLDPPYTLVRDPLGFKRVMDQLAAIISRLTPDGYAILRTPWPLLLEAPAPATIESTPAKSRSRARTATPRPARRGHWEEVWTIEQNRTLDEAIHETDEPASPQPDSPAPHSQGVKPDLTIPGALGPEIHEYSTMAVHLYMRKEQPGADHIAPSVD